MSVASQERVQRTNELVTGRSKLSSVLRGTLPQDSFATRREPNEHLPAVGGVTRPLDESALLQAIDQAYRAVVTDLEALGKSADRCLHSLRQASEHQQKLMLLRLEIGRAGNLLAEMQEA